MAEAKDYSAEALLAKEKEVELDTDDVKEESIEVEEKSETKKEPNLNLGEVDLGYTGHEKPKEEKSEKPEIEVTEEKKEEDKQGKTRHSTIDRTFTFGTHSRMVLSVEPEATRCPVGEN